jgi:DNA polymerase-3 subunit alpha
VDTRCVNKAVIESLVKSGAFDSLHENRAAIVAAIENAIQAGSNHQAALRAGQSNLFFGTTAVAEPAQIQLPKVPDWQQGQKMAYEKETLGFYVTSHPLRDVEEHLHDFVTLTSQTLAAAPDQKEGIIGGLVTNVDQRTVRSGPNAGQKWATVQIEDLLGSIRVQLFASDFQKFGSLIKPEGILLMRGKVDRSREQPNFRVSEIFTLEQSYEKLARELLIELPVTLVETTVLESCSAVLSTCTGGRVPVKFALVESEGPLPWRAAFNTKMLVKADAALPAKLQQINSSIRVRIRGPGAALARAPRPVLQPA